MDSMRGISFIFAMVLVTLVFMVINSITFLLPAEKQFIYLICSALLFGLFVFVVRS